MALLVASDLILDKYVYAYSFSWDLFLTWGWYAAMLFLGTALRENAKPLRVAGAALTGSVSFFLVSNFGVWAATNMYAKTMSGLVLPALGRGARGGRGGGIGRRRGLFR